RGPRRRRAQSAPARWSWSSAAAGGAAPRTRRCPADRCPARRARTAWCAAHGRPARRSSPDRRRGRRGPARASARRPATHRPRPPAVAWLTCRRSRPRRAVAILTTLPARGCQQFVSAPSAPRQLARVAFLRRIGTPTAQSHATSGGNSNVNARHALLVGCSIAVAATGHARADATGDLQAQMNALQQQLDAVKSQLEALQKQQKQQKQQPAAAPAQGGGSFFQLKPDSGATFLVPGGGEVQLYGNLDVSFDMTTKGLKSDYGVNGGVPVGKMGWEPSIGTNLSYVGVRGKHPLMDDLGFVWQLEAGIDISATPGTKETMSNTSDVVTGALFSRNSFVGFSGHDWGAAMIGKSETPYKTST